MKVKYLYSLHYCYGKSAGAHLSVLQTPDRWVALKTVQLLLSTENICPSSVNSACCLIWSCPLRRGCPLWGRRSKVCRRPTFPSSNPQIRGLSVAECWAVCLLTLSHRLNLYKQGVFTLPPGKRRRRDKRSQILLWETFIFFFRLDGNF